MEQTKTYDVYQVIDVIEMLSHSQGFYGGILARIRYFQEYDPEKFEEFKQAVEAQQFKDPIEVIMFFET